MELNFTGKGSAFYPPFKNTGAYMLSGKALYLIDCGETMFDVLYHKLDLASIEDVYVILTHMHADHVGSLGTLISYFYCLFNKAIHVVYPQETIKQLLTLEGITPLGYHYHETLPENPAGLTAVPVEVKHALDMKCYGYVLSDGRLIANDQAINVTCQGTVIYGLTKETLKESILSLFIQSMTKLDPILINLIKEIHYEPMYGDNNRFSLFLKDGNTINVNSYSIVNKLKYYQTMVDKVSSLYEGVKGTYHLDVGDYFEPYSSSGKVLLRDENNGLLTEE